MKIDFGAARVDKLFVKFKGRLSFKHYNAKKRARFGVKLFKLADCDTKIVMDILSYQGATMQMLYADMKKQLGFGGAAVLNMLEAYLGQGVVASPEKSRSRGIQ